MNSSYEKRLGENIRRLRKNQSMTQEELSAKLQLRGCDMTRSALAKIEVGQRHIYAEEIKLIKEILNISFNNCFCLSFIFKTSFSTCILPVLK